MSQLWNVLAVVPVYRMSGPLAADTGEESGCWGTWTAVLGPRDDKAMRAVGIFLTGVFEPLT
jgi:hypothetical protein